jgi:NADH:ubiquinone oxidoreductase subunit 3 (subunit A)
MEAVLYSPPVIFILMFLSVAMLSRWLSKFSSKGKMEEHALDPYACGQRNVENYVNPDYSQYYSYAFIFTVVHILILVVATAPADASILPVAYVVSGMLAILIAFKR